VLPLDLPPEDSTRDAAESGQAAAVRLFLDRGSAARGRPGGGVAPAAAAERICRKLDGLPLAIELAAARLGTLSAAEIEAHLADRFRFLAYRRAPGDPRHRALRTAIDWRYELLSAEERSFLVGLSVFAGTFGIAEAAAVCGARDRLSALEVIDRLASKSLVIAEPAADGTRYRLLDTIRQYAADRLAEAGGTEAARQRHAAAFLRLAERQRDPAMLDYEADNFRGALEWSLSRGNPAGRQLARVLGEYLLYRGLVQEGRGWLERALTLRPADGHLRADLLRLLGTVLCEAGDLQAADRILAAGAETAATVDAGCARARISVLRADIQEMQGTPDAVTLQRCEQAAAVLEAGGDLDGLAEALTHAGKLRFWLGDLTGAEEVLERAIGCAKQAGNRRVQMRASHWLAVSFHTLPIPVDAAVTRTEQLLRDAGGDVWAEADMLKPLCALYAYQGRFADARAAITLSRAALTRLGAKLALAESAIPAALVALTAGDPAGAERYAREGYQAFRAMGKGGGLMDGLVGQLAEALYAQGRFDEARTAGQAQRGPVAIRYDKRLTEAKLLARDSQFTQARQVLSEVAASNSPVPSPLDQAYVVETKAEVERLAGNPERAAASLRAALHIYEDRRATSLADQARSALADLTGRTDR
jgi:hypothetical protein